MKFEPALAEEMKTVESLGNRVYPLLDPEAVAKNGVPYLIYGSSEGLRTKELEGYQDGKTVQGELNIVAARYADMKSIAHEVVDLLVSMEQRVIGTKGPFIQELTYQQPVEIYEEKPDLYRCHIEFEVYFREVG